MPNFALQQMHAFTSHHPDLPYRLGHQANVTSFLLFRVQSHMVQCSAMSCLCISLLSLLQQSERAEARHIDRGSELPCMLNVLHILCKLAWGRMIPNNLLVLDTCFAHA